MKHSLHAFRVSPHRAACGLALVALLASALPPPAWAANAPKPPDPSTSSPAEARTPIGPDTTPGDTDATPSLFKITQPGSYYLTGNINGVAGKAGIEIAASRVTIDLNGFTLQGVAGSLNGVNVATLVRQLTVRNGAISGWVNGINNPYDDGRFVDLAITGNTGTGLSGGASMIVTDCIASSNGQIGVRALSGSVLTRVVARANHDGIWTVGDGLRLIDCSAADNTTFGIVNAGESNSLAGCVATNNGGEGFQTQGYTSIDRCTAKNNMGHGFSVGASSTISRSTAHFNNLDGFKLLSGVVITDSTATSNTQDGFETGAQARVENCSSASNGRYGFWLGTGSQIRGSVARLNAIFGYTIESHCHVESNVALSNGLQAPSNVIAAGFNVLANGCRIDGNTAGLNAAGFVVQTGDTLLLRNCARGNTNGNYLLAPAAEYGQIITNPGAAFVATNPWANFAY